MSTKDIRRLLGDLAAWGVLISYTVSMHFGQRVMVWGEDGRPVSMPLSVAEMYRRRLERWEWWGRDAI